MEAGLVVFEDYVSPYCYLAQPVLERLAAAGVRIERRAYELWPSPVEVPDLHAMIPRSEFDSVVVPLAGRIGLEVRYPSIATRTRKPHEAVALAREEGVAAEMHRALYRAYFVDGRDIGRIDELVAIGESIGLDRTALKVALDVDRFSDRIDADRARADALGISAVPAFVRQREAGSEVRFGWLDYDALSAWVGSETERGREA